MGWCVPLIHTSFDMTDIMSTPVEKRFLPLSLSVSETQLRVTSGAAASTSGRTSRPVSKSDVPTSCKVGGDVPTLRDQAVASAIENSGIEGVRLRNADEFSGTQPFNDIDMSDEEMEYLQHQLKIQLDVAGAELEELKKNIEHSHWKYGKGRYQSINGVEVNHRDVLDCTAVKLEQVRNAHLEHVKEAKDLIRWDFNGVSFTATDFKITFKDGHISLWTEVNQTDPVGETLWVKLKIPTQFPHYEFFVLEDAQTLKDLVFVDQQRVKVFDLIVNKMWRRCVQEEFSEGTIRTIFRWFIQDLREESKWLKMNICWFAQQIELSAFTTMTRFWMEGYKKKTRDWVTVPKRNLSVSQMSLISMAFPRQIEEQSGGNARKERRATREQKRRDVAAERIREEKRKTFSRSKKKETLLRRARWRAEKREKIQQQGWSECLRRVKEDASTARDAAKAVIQVAEVVNNPMFAQTVGGIIGEASDAANNLKSMGDGISKGADVILSLKKMFTNLYNSFISTLEMSLALVLFAAFFWWLLEQIESKPVCIILTTVVAGVLGVHWDHLAKFFQHGKIEQQGFPEVTDSLAGIVGLGLVSSMVSGKVTHSAKGLANHIADSLGKTPRVFAGIDILFNTVSAMIKKAADAIRGWLDLPPIKWTTQWGEKFDTTLYVVKDIEMNELTRPNDDPPARYARMIAAKANLHDLTTMYRDDRRALDLLRDAERRLDRHMIKLKNQVGAGRGYRVMPVSVVLAGDPGVGKTMGLMALIIAALRGAAIIPKMSAQDASAHIYSKPFNSKYMDGYYGQPAYLWDDAWAIKPTPNDEANPFLDVMTYQNGFTNLVNMAECSEKGMWPFTSRLFVLTTNCRSLSEVNADQILLCQPAFQRRIDIHVEVKAKKEYQNDKGFLCMDKFAEEAAKCRTKATSFLDAYPWHVWEVFYTKFSDAPPTFAPGTGQPFVDLIDKMIRLLRSRESVYKNLMDSLEVLMNADIPEQYRVEQQSGLGPTSVKEWIEAFKEEYQVSSADLGLSPNPEISPAVASGSFSFGVRAESDDSHRYDEEGEAESAMFQFLTERQAYEAKLKKAFEEAQARGDLGPEAVYVPLSNVEDMCETGSVAHETIVAANDIKAWYNKAFGRVREIVSDVVETIKHSLSLKIIVGTLAALASAGIVMAIVYSAKAIWEWVRDSFFVRSRTEEPVEEQSNGPKSKVVRFKVPTQSFGDAKSLWYHPYVNSFKISVWPNEDEGHILGQVIFLKLDYFVMPLHFVADLNRCIAENKMTLRSKVIFRCCGPSQHTYDLTVGQFLDFPRVEYPDRDLAFCRFTNQIPPRRDIIDKIALAKDFEKLGGQPVRLDTARMAEDGVIIPFHQRETYLCKSVQAGTNPREIGCVWHKKWLCYFAQTITGDCGAPLCLQEYSGFNNRCLIGLHVGGIPRIMEGYATPLDQEICLDAIKRLEKKSPPPVMEHLTYEQVVIQSGISDLGITVQETSELPFTDDSGERFGSFEPVAVVSKGVSSPVRSNLRPTHLGLERTFDGVLKEYYREEQPRKEIMKLSPFKRGDEWVYPMKEALKSYATDIKVIDQAHWNDSVHVAMKPFSDVTRHFSGRKLSFEEAVLGVPELGLKSIPRSTSMGYPFCTVYKSKKEVFGDGVDFDLTTEEAIDLRDRVLKLEALVKEGKRPFFICRGFLKDEIRNAGKPSRYIAGVDLQYYILCRMYFGAYVAAMMKTYRDSGICVSMNPYRDFSWLHTHMTRHGRKVWDGDFKEFDKNQHPGMQWGCQGYINSWYALRGGETDNDARNVLFLDLVQSRHLIAASGTATHIVQWQKSLPSGHFLTSTINSMISMSCIVSGYLATVGQMDFWEHAVAASMGDDNLAGASDEVIDRFNQVTLAQHLKDAYNMEYTPGRKDTKLTPYCDISEVVFLQRKFAVKNNKVVCPIRPESFLTSMYYINKGDSLYTTKTIEACLENALSELSMHTEDFWNKVAPIIGEELKRIGRSPMHDITTSEAYLRLTLNRDDPGFKFNI